MKALRHLSLALLILFTTRVDAELVATNDQVRVEVKVASDTDHKDLARTTADKVIQHETLKISLSGKARSGETRVVKWTAYGKNLKNNNVRALESGEFKLALNAQGSQTAESKQVTTSYTPEHGVVTKGNNNGGLKGNNNGGLKGNKANNARTKTVDAEGEKFIGYSVQVLDGTKVVGEAAEPDGVAGQH